jgi:hypothetical protein
MDFHQNSLFPIIADYGITAYKSKAIIGNLFL